MDFSRTLPLRFAEGSLATCLASLFQSKRGDAAAGLQHSHRASFCPTHHPLFRRLKIVVASQMKPPMDDVKREFLSKGAAVFSGVI